MIADRKGRGHITVGFSSYQEFGVQRFLAEISKVQLDLYARQFSTALDRVERMWPEFSHSMMRRVQLCRIHAYHHSGYAYLAVAACSDADQRQSALRQASGYARALEKEAIEWAWPFAAYIRASIQYLEGNHSAAITDLNRAIKGFEKTGMRLYSSASQRRLGQALGGDAGNDQVASAEAVFSEQGVLDPARLACMMAPAFGDMSER